MIAALEKWLLESGVPLSRLETGIHQHAALRFYEKLGYARMAEPFGEYKCDPLSVFMEKKLDPSLGLIRAHDGACYLVAFTSRLRKNTAGYGEVAEKMVRRATDQPGFLGLSSSRNADGDGFTVSYWRDRAAVSEWGRDPEHLEAQRLGREEFYEKFKVFVARVEAR